MGIIDIVGNNFAQIDAVEYEKKVREKYPEALLQQDERIVFAFKSLGGSGRDHYMLTTKRLLIKDKMGVTGKQIGYKTVPYTSVRAFSFETCGSFDTDSEMKVYARGIGTVSIDFNKNVDVLAIQRFLSSVVIQGKGAGEEYVSDAGGGYGNGSGDGNTGIFDLLGSNYTQIDKHELESRLKPSVLLPEEKVELAFKCGRDSVVFTSMRVLKIDVQGMTGKKIEYLTILWPSIRGFSIETAGNILDRDSELTLYFNLPAKECHAEGFPQNERTRMKIDFRDGQADIFAVQKFISDKLLGPDTVAPSSHGGAMTGYQDTGSGSILAWLGDDSRMVDPREAEEQFKFILQSCESVELAFKGRRDMILFTTKRVIFVDKQGLFGIGKKVEFISVPWRTITTFSVRSAGSFIDKDSELCLWLDFDDVYYPRRANEDDPPPPPIPRKSCMEIDFQKDKVDIFVVHRYLSERVMRVKGHQMKPYTSPVSSELLMPSSPDTATNLLDWIGDNASAIDPNACDVKFHEAGLLQHDEHIAFAFKSGRDSIYLTNKRLFVLDVQGFTGKKKEYMSVPLDNIRVWSVESAGHLDRDMELRVWFKGYWDNKVKQDLRKGKADIFAIQSFIAHFVIGDADGNSALKNAQAFEPAKTGAMTKILGYLSDAHVKDPVELTSQLRSSPALLQEDESVEAAFKAGRDLFIITTKRIIVIDKKGITGKSVDYRSFPLMYNTAFKIETEGRLLSGPEVKVYTADEDIKQELAKGQKNNIWQVHEILSNKMLNDPKKDFSEEEVHVSNVAQPSYNSTPAPAQQHSPVVAAQPYVQPTTFQVQVPAGMVAGQQIQVQHPHTNQMLVITVPNGVPAGGVFNVSA
eukprot:CAMPEP_0201723202 /NCGR_PEP_ID=MMETSP0593-20130828/7332_1 /ASSEMBLY_ACC=CAM_ASM_000672 /TAXON_ID=267983 /ORGANISM="Skeletonema japonicum, Strain CCMP2506" /LENGTH=861 /DNA_ID=CAMNT_0048214277 /DNA_START=191 /DNA_END=2776 /DNA_ORIENTATION=+